MNQRRRRAKFTFGGKHPLETFFGDYQKAWNNTSEEVAKVLADVSDEFQYSLDHLQQMSDVTERLATLGDLMYDKAAAAGFTDAAIQEYINKTNVQIDPEISSMMREIGRMFAAMQPIMETMVAKVEKIMDAEIGIE